MVIYSRAAVLYAKTNELIDAYYLWKSINKIQNKYLKSTFSIINCHKNLLPFRATQTDQAIYRVVDAQVFKTETP